MAALGIISSFAQTNYQAAVAKNNAKIALANANKTSEATQLAQQRSDNEYAALAGQQEAVQSASGLDLLGRTQVLTRMQTTRVQGQAASDIVNDGTTKARDYLQQSANFKGQAHILHQTAWANLIADTTEAVGKAVLGMPPGPGAAPANGSAGATSGLDTSMVGGSSSLRRRTYFGNEASYGNGDILGGY